MEPQQQGAAIRHTLQDGSTGRSRHVVIPAKVVTYMRHRSSTA